MNIDLRSDTLTRPTPGMIDAMFSAKVGDDVFAEDPTVNELEDKIAQLFGKEAALFCPSGTMTNQIAIRVHTQPQEELICDKKSHVYNYEGGGIAYNSLVSVKLVDGDRGRPKASQVEENINPDDIHAPRTSLVCLENTMNKGGGSIYDIKEIKAIREVCQRHQLKLHLDGARLFNAMVETADQPKNFGDLFDSISICLSKGLGAPVGSLLIGNTHFINKARRVRKVLGGGMRQAGYLAAAGIYALDHQVSQLKIDHQRAKIIEENLDKLNFVEYVLPVETNIVIFKTREDLSADQLLYKFDQLQIKAVKFGKKEIRLVTHLDFTEDLLNEFLDRIKQVQL